MPVMRAGGASGHTLVETFQDILWPGTSQFDDQGGCVSTDAKSRRKIVSWNLTQKLPQGLAIVASRSLRL